MKSSRFSYLIYSIYIVSFGLALISRPELLKAQDRGFGYVIGGLDNENNVTSYLSENERGIRVSVIISSGVGGFQNIGGQGGGGGGARTLDLPLDTDYLELLIYYLNLDPRQIRKNKITLFRVDQSGTSPYMSKNIARKWLTYDFEEEYDKGGPFTLLHPGDIIIVQRRGLLNRPAFDFLADVRTFTSLASIFLIFYGVYQSYSNIIR